jgi:hypothetical protein
VHRDFDAARRERQAKRVPVQFTLGGERFTLLPVIPIGSAFDLIDAPEITSSDDMGSTAVRALCSFIAGSLADGQTERWEAVLRSTADPVDPESILEVATYITEVYTGRPTGPSTGSSDGRKPSGQTSKKPGRKAS